MTQVICVSIRVASFELSDFIFQNLLPFLKKKKSFVIQTFYYLLQFDFGIFCFEIFAFDHYHRIQFSFSSQLKLKMK